MAWDDACTNLEDEFDPNDTHAKFGKTIRCEDIGFLVRKTKKEVVLAVGRCHEDNTFRHSNTIPRKMVVSITPISLEEPNGQNATPQISLPNE